MKSLKVGLFFHGYELKTADSNCKRASKASLNSVSLPYSARNALGGLHD